MGKQRDSAQIARDRRRIADMYLSGRLQADIAQEIGVSQATVSRDLKVLHTEWLKSAALDFSIAKSRELAKIDRLERENWDAWQRSKQDAETVTERGKGKPGSKPEDFEKTIQRKGQVGDPSFLRGVQWCIEKRCKILGLDAPVKKDITTDGQPIESTFITIYANDDST